MYAIPLMAFLLEHPQLLRSLISVAAGAQAPAAKFVHGVLAGPQAEEAFKMLPTLAKTLPLIRVASLLFDEGAARGNASNIPDVEYFSLGKIIKGITNVIAPIAKVAAPVVGGLIGGPAGAAVGAAIGGIAGGGIAGPGAPKVEAPKVGLISPQGSTLMQLGTEDLNILARNALVMAKTSGPESAFMYLATSVPQMREVVQLMRNIRANSLFDDDPRASCKVHGRLEVLRDEELVAGNRLVTPGSFGRTGVFYRSPLVVASLSDDLASGVFGQIEFADMPYKISIARRAGQGRARIALAHELAHLANRVHKLGLNHDKVHALGVFYATEGQKVLNSLPV
jgi:hypothetical protein